MMEHKLSKKNYDTFSVIILSNASILEKPREFPVVWTASIRGNKPPLRVGAQFFDISSKIYQTETALLCWPGEPPKAANNDG